MKHIIFGENDAADVASDSKPEATQAANPEKEATEPPKNQETRQVRNHRKNKPVYTRIKVDPTRRYHQPEERESWGPNVKGKKFKKEKGKKKRCPNSNLRIDGSVKSIRLDG